MSILWYGEDKDRGRLDLGTHIMQGYHKSSRLLQEQVNFRKALLLWDLMEFLTRVTCSHSWKHLPTSQYLPLADQQVHNLILDRGLGNICISILLPSSLKSQQTLPAKATLFSSLDQQSWLGIGFARDSRERAREWQTFATFSLVKVTRHCSGDAGQSILLDLMPQHSKAISLWQIDHRLDRMLG